MYKQLFDARTGEISTFVIIRTADTASIPMVNDNTDYQAFLLWKSEGNVAQPADEETV